MIRALLPIRRQVAFIAALACLCCGSSATPAKSEQIAFRSYGKVEGLTNAWFSCLEQDSSGYIFACTEHGLYVYDGRRFLNLGPRQGLPDGGLVSGLTFDARRHMFIRYPHAIFVSTTPVTSHAPPATLSFRAAASKIGPIPDDSSGQLIPWDDGAVFVSKGRLFTIQNDAASGQPVVEPAATLFKDAELPLRISSPLAAGRSTLWTVAANHDICGLGATFTRCFGAREGIPSDDWVALLVARNGHVMARSPTRLADIDPETRRVVVSLLPDQGGSYENYPTALLLAQSPSGQLLTQSAGGLIVGDPSSWTVLRAENGMPSVPIFKVMFDRQGSLWLGVLGRGLARALGYGAWENFNHHDGLSNDILWQMVRQPDGPLWVASDGGIDAVGAASGTVLARRHYDKAAFSVAFDTSGRLWRSVGSTKVARVALDDGRITEYPLPQVSQILRGPGRQLWFITGGGVFGLSTATEATPQPVGGLSGFITAGTVAPDGELWALRGQELLHRHADGSVVSVQAHWPQAAFEPLALVVGTNQTMWVAGAGGGLYRLQLDKDQIRASTRFQPPDIISNSVVSLLIDSRGWLWAGTDNGLSVFDGKRWVSATSDLGLIWDDLDQGSLLEDADGSMWVGTSQGLSHLLAPARLFETTHLKPEITSVTIGGTPFRERAVAYTRQPVVIHFATLDFRADKVIRYRYRLSGVDTDWVDTAIDEARYPWVPAGHHRFEVMSYDPLNHQLSAPALVLVRIKKPWWFWWPLLVGYSLIGLAVGWSILHLRFRYLLQQKRALQRAVDAKTQEIREAHDALRLQASRDSLTGLLTRGEIQSRLVEILENAGHPPALTIGLLDIDHFKRINDQFGHLAGDDILQEVGRRLRLALEEQGEHAGRYGGEEILLVLEAGPEEAMQRIIALKHATCGLVFDTGSGPVTVTCSIGVASVEPQDDWSALVGRADEALYDAKSAGRDRITVSSRELATSGLRITGTPVRRRQG